MAASSRRIRLETAEAFCDGHVAAFEFFGGVPQNRSHQIERFLAVAARFETQKRLASEDVRGATEPITCLKIALGGRERAMTRAKSEGLVEGFVRRNFMTPLPVAEVSDAFDARLLDASPSSVRRSCAATLCQSPSGCQRSSRRYRSLPPAPYDVADKVTARSPSVTHALQTMILGAGPLWPPEILAKGYEDR